MKKIFAILAVFVLTSQLSFAQFKKYDDKKPSYKSSNNLLLGFINPNNFSMRHSFNVSMMTTAYGNVSLTSYINSMNYRISNKLDVSADVKFQYSPFANSNLGSAYSTSLQKNLSGISLSRASLNYKISDNAFINFEYREVDESDYFNNNYNPFNSGYNGYNYWR
ncbi:MAG: hypothetical protein SGI89_00035 [bacterium]|nr:hypothetical protein [bacterium]